jgi:hypothetical protein
MSANQSRSPINIPDRKNLLPVFKVRERRRRAIGITTQEISCGIGFATAIAFEAAPASPISSFQLS